MEVETGFETFAGCAIAHKSQGKAAGKGREKIPRIPRESEMEAPYMNWLKCGPDWLKCGPQVW